MIRMKRRKERKEFKTEVQCWQDVSLNLFSHNKTGTDRFQDCCKNRTFNQGFFYNGCKNVLHF